MTDFEYFGFIRHKITLKYSSGQGLILLEFANPKKLDKP